MEQKKYFLSININIYYYVVVPDETSQKEIKNTLREKDKINHPEYYSTIDDIITVSELIKIIES